MSFFGDIFACNAAMAAANYNGFMVYDFQYDGDNISDIVKRVHISSHDMDSDIGDNRAQNVIIAPINNQAFILDKEDHIWLFDYNDGINALRAYLSKGDPSCYEASCLSIAIDESSNQIRIYSLIKHYSGGLYWKKDSRSLITTNIELSDINKDIECNYKFNKNDISDIIFYSDNLLTLGGGELGIQVYRFNEALENTCVATNNDGKLIYTQNKVRTPLSKQHLLTSLLTFYKDDEDTAQEISKFIMDTRETKVKETIRRKQQKNIKD